MPDIENRGIDEDFFIFLCETWKYVPIHQALDISLIYLGKGIAGLKMSVRPDLTTIKGRLHGGITATLVDTAMGWAVLSLGYNCVTLNMSIDYFIPAFIDNELIVEANVVHSGKKTLVAEATVFNGKGENVAKSRGIFFVKKGSIQELEQVVV